MSTWAVSTRLLVLVVAMLLSSLLIGVSGLYGLKSILGSLNTVYLDRVVPLRDLKVIADLYAVNIVDASHKVRNGNFSYSEGVGEMVKAKTSINDIWRAYLNTTLIPEEKQLIAQIQPLMERANEPMQRLESIMRRQDASALQQFIINELYQQIDPLSAKFSELIEVQLRESENQYRLGVELHDKDVMLILGLLICSLVGGGAIAWVIAQQLQQQLGTEPSELNQLASLIAHGNLAQPAHVGKRTGVLQSVEMMRQGLHEMIGQISDGSTRIEAAASALSGATDQILEGASHQSGLATSMAAAMEELSVSIRHIADSAQQAEKTVQQAGSSSKAGTEVMQEAIREISQIAEIVEESASDIDQLAEQSSNINSIVNVIRGIAEQTNLLALNAAIEAARAGEQGRGFAVVADEVRSLAGRTAQSTTEIVALVSAIQNGTSKAKDSMSGGRTRIAHGLQLVEEAGGTMAQINQSMSDTLTATASIAVALKEQRMASDEVAMNVERVVHTVEANTEAINGIARSTQGLQSLGRNLSQLTHRFSL